jgi:hypothetical protein
MARPHFEAFNKAVLTAENWVIKAQENLIAHAKKARLANKVVSCPWH